MVYVTFGSVAGGMEMAAHVYGFTVGALAAGLPLVAVPLFADQPDTARRVAAVGAGLSVAPEAEAMRDAVSEVLADGSYRASAEDVAAELRSQPATDVALEALESA